MMVGKTITALEFAERDYTAKVARGECEVTYPSYNNRIVVKVTTYSDMRKVWMTFSNNETYDAIGTELLSVHWLNKS